MKVTIFVQRQNDLVVCKLKPTHRWFWTACYNEVKKLVGKELELDECISADLDVSNIQYLGKLVFEEERRRYLEEKQKAKGIEGE